MRTGLDRNTGDVLTDWDECAQSIGVIVTTAIGTVTLARDFGSNGPALQDRPMNEATIFDHVMAIAEALRREEPGFRLKKVNILQGGADGTISFEQTGDYYPNGHLGDYSIVETNRSAVAGPFALTALVGVGAQA